MTKHYEITYKNKFYKISTNSINNAFNIFINHFPDSDKNQIIIDAVSKTFFMTLDYEELKEDDI